MFQLRSGPRNLVIEGWDRVAKFKLSIQTTEFPAPSYVEEGIVKEADVYFYYESITSDLKFAMYLDEEEVVKATLNGEALSFSNCVHHNFDQSNL